MERRLLVAGGKEAIGSWCKGGYRQLVERKLCSGG